MSSSIRNARSLERVRYFQRQLLTVEDMVDEQTYVLEKLRRHNRLLHGWGVVCGCEVVPAESERPWEIDVCCGHALTPQGDEISIGDHVTIDLAVGPPGVDDPCCPKPCPPKAVKTEKDGRRTVYLAVRYVACEARPVRVHPAGCGCGEAGCEYSRVRDDFEMRLLDELPAAHEAGTSNDYDFHKRLRAWVQQGGEVPVPPCPRPTDDPWVVLATIRLPASPTTAITREDISYRDRRALFSVATLMAALR